MDKSDLVRLQHMLDSVEAILKFTYGKRRASLDKNRLLFSAIIRELEILGEAAGQVSPKVRDKFSHIPWKKLIGMRNRLIHAYFNVDSDIIWKTIKEYLPELRTDLTEIIHLHTK